MTGGSPAMDIRGGCHCGAVRYRLLWPATGAIPARACGCGFCRKHGARWTSHPAATLALAIDASIEPVRYAFATGTAEFLLCARCGVPTAVTSVVDGRLYAVVNTNTIERPSTLVLEPLAVSFDDEPAPERLARRARGWIADVVLTRVVPGPAPRWPEPGPC